MDEAVFARKLYTMTQELRWPTLLLKSLSNPWWKKRPVNLGGHSFQRCSRLLMQAGEPDRFEFRSPVPQFWN